MKFTAEIITGSGRGKKIGYPTINLNLDDVAEGIEEGIYAGKVFIDSDRLPLATDHSEGDQKSVTSGQFYFAAIHYGPRPFYNDSKAFEVHIIDTELNILPQEIEIELIEKLRDIKDFESEEDLKSQISKDIKEAMIILESE